jgi:hypothetical protein
MAITKSLLHSAIICSLTFSGIACPSSVIVLVVVRRGCEKLRPGEVGALVGGDAKLAVYDSEMRVTI